jgi:hypothetical protein
MMRGTETGRNSPRRTSGAKRVTRFVGLPLLQILACLVLAGSAFGCGRPGDHPESSGDLSLFTEDAVISGRVRENVTACTVDAVCYLRIEFADTSIVALYGSGERPAPLCEISKEVSDVAFEVQAGDPVEVMVSMCEAGRHYVRQLIRTSG